VTKSTRAFPKQREYASSFVPLAFEITNHKQMTMKHFGRLFLLLFFCLTTLASSAQRTFLHGKCVGVADGDSFTLLDDKNNTVKIRLAHVDCPEKGQPFGKNAKQFTAHFCYGQRVVVAYDGANATDRYGRLIGVVFNSQQEELNYALVEAGLAWHFKKYSTEERYSIAERSARRQGKGLWSAPNPIEPWNWRKKKK
jgi:endonuclease YncB( thermonuclease family)